MIREHWFWYLVLLAVLIWYSTVTLFIGVRGTMDIRDMLKRLKDRNGRQ